MYSTATNLHLHTPTYRSHLPTHPSSPDNSNPTYRIEIWTSVSSALCTATNNPQNGELSHAGMKSTSLVLTHTHTNARTRACTHTRTHNTCTHNTHTHTHTTHIHTHTHTHPSQRPTRAFVQKCSQQPSVYSKAEWKWPGLLSPSLPPALPTTVGHKTTLSLSNFINMHA